MFSLTLLVKKEYDESNPMRVFEDVYNVILDRKKNPKEGSYTNYLFDKGIDKILRKLEKKLLKLLLQQRILILRKLNMKFLISYTT